jgi:hypothetical protein
MSAAASKLISVLEAILTEQHADEETGLRPVEEFRRVQRVIRDSLAITDSPDSGGPYQIADFIYWNCESASSHATERYLAALTEEQKAKFQLGDVLSCLSPGQYNDIDKLADEAEAERRGE